MEGDLGKLIVAKGFENLPELQKIAQSGHTVRMAHYKRFLLKKIKILHNGAPSSKNNFIWDIVSVEIVLHFA